ncbi:MAG: 2Fe-2S iron-sulfur cluster binding domain-containing protein [Fibrobacter sp.]|nr:2Fe-2S iron-sulfur cluster binding domain-containing protein [Fibrobacter sp.]
MATIDINRGTRQLTVEDDQKLIDVLKSQGIHLPSACGNKGTCGLCKVKMLSDCGPYTQAELNRLTESERAGGIRLSCQITTRETMKVQLPPEFLTSQDFISRVAGKNLLTKDIVELRLELVSPDNISFLPGQYILLKVPSYGGNKPVMRPFSIASSNREKTYIELNIRLNPDGICTPWIFNILEEGQEVRFSGPRGNFYIQNSENPMLFIAGGSGMAPVRSILKTMADNGISRKAVFYFGATTHRDLFYSDEMRNLESRIPEFRFVPTLSREPQDSEWQGARGLVTELVDRDMTGDLSRYEAYLCGRPAMIEGCINILEKKGIPREKMFFDLFNVARSLK